MKHEYYIAIIGDNILEGNVELTQEEIGAFYKVVNALKPDGKYVPQIEITDVTLVRQERARKRQEEFAAALEERKRQEQFREECSHLGKYSVGDKFREAFAEKGWAV